MVLHYNSSICMVCNEAIFNPICPSCLVREVRHWIDGNISNNIASSVVRFAESLKEEFYSEGIQCVICRDNETPVCPYCFTEEIYTFIVESGGGKKFIEEFMTHFNYDFEHEGYEKDFEDNYEK